MFKQVINLLLLLLGIYGGLFACEYGLRIYEAHFPFVIGISQTEKISREDHRWWGMATLERGVAKNPPHYVLSRNSRLFYEPNTWFYEFQTRLQNNPGAYRIFVLGDSTTRLGPCVDLDTDYYSYKLELLLNRDQGGKYITVNCGIPGYATEQEVEFLEKKLLSLKPNLVIVGYCLNDREIKHRIIAKQGYYLCTDLLQNVPFCPNLPFSKELYIHSELYKLVNYSIVRICRIFNQSTSYADLGSYATIKALQKLKCLSQTHNFKTIFIIFPTLEDYEGSEEERVWITENLKNLGFDFIDMKEAFDAYGISSLKIAVGDKYHFNTTGHALVARELYNYLQNNVLYN